MGRLLDAYRLRWKRRRLLGRAIARRRELVAVVDRTKDILPDEILCFAVVRNEAVRLPWFLEHHRKLGVARFLVVDNDSDDGTAEFLAAQPDVSLWHTRAGYKASRFGLDWTNWLLARYGHGHWCLTLDADEALVYPYCDTRDLRALTAWLDGQGRGMFGAMMLDMYPKGPLGAQDYRAGEDPFRVLEWFDAANYGMRVQQPMGNLWLQGGPRARVFFADAPERAPTLNKVPLVRWNRRYAYVNSTHSILPPRLNRFYETDGGEAPSGLLLHSKFLNVAVARAGEEKMRGEHFSNPALYDRYYEAVAADPDLWCSASRRFTGWRGLEAAGLMSRGGWL